MDKKIVELVQNRAGGFCEVCGGYAEDTMALHHRKLRSRGGKDCASNLIWIHHGCHNLNTDSIHNNPADSTERGWMVASWNDPEKTPFVTPQGYSVYLKVDGTKQKGNNE